MDDIISVTLVDDRIRDLERLRHCVQNIKGCNILNAYTQPKQLLEDLVTSKQIPHIIITDCQMPEIDGMGLTRLVQLFLPQIKIIVVSGLLTEPDVVELLDAGAAAVIAKGSLHNNNSTQLQKAIHTVMQQKIFIDPFWEKALVKKLLNNLQHKKEQQTIPDFSENELKILQLMATHHDYKAIVGLLHLSSRTIENYALKIAQKTGEKNKLGMVLYGIKKNLIKLFRH